MASLEEIREGRLHKLNILKERGINPFPAQVPRDFTIKFLKDNFDAQVSSGADISVAGRVMALRGQGAILFAVLFDGTEKVQAIVKRDTLGEEVFKLFTDTVDIGDFISVTGVAILSKTGEQSIDTKVWTMATKTLLPMPEKWHGLQDIDERYRKRYLDFLMDPELRELMVRKSKFWDATRTFMKQNDFLEMETPTIETTTGGAEANPFKTHHDDYDMDVYLRISVGELWQKRLMAGGFPRTFEIGRVYRNEGSSPDHTQEFTNMEFYASFMTYDEGINFTEELIKYIAKESFGKTEFTTRGHTFNLDGVWERKSYVDIVKEKTGVDVITASAKEMKDKLDELKVKYEGDNKERLTDTLWKYCRKQISGPVWITNVPKIVSPLAKANTENSELTLRVQLVLAGAEVTNGFAELNDPIDQQERFDVQKKLIEGGDKEAMMSDYEFVEMLEHGMPPTFGFGMGGDRIFSFFADKPLRELQTFPLMRPKSE